MYLLVVILLLAASLCVSGQQGHGSHAMPQKSAIVLDGGLGEVDHPVITKSPEAQKFFDQGLAYIYGFNHAEAIRSFKRAAEIDPSMAMAYWGTSLALGSNYNVTADTQQLTEAYAALQTAIRLAPKASTADQAYIKALSRRYAQDPATDRKKLAAEYKAAMGELVKQYPDDLDAATLYAESMMNLRPWRLWSLDGKPAEGTPEIIAVLEGVLRRDPRHIGANHYYIHAVEASPTPERGMAAAMRLGGLAPNAGHLVHMPSHIYLRTGDFAEAAKSNDLAVIADRNYIKRSGSQGIYPLMYYNHNLHMLAASHIGSGNYAGALAAARDLESNLGPNVAAMPMLEMFMPYHLVTLIRFHKSNEILSYPQPPGSLAITNCFWRFARGLALAESGKPVEADKELGELRKLAGSLPAGTGFGNSTADAVFNVAIEMLSGEIALAKGEKAAAIEALKRAVAAE